MATESKRQIDMILADKLKLLRSLEGALRGINRPLSKADMARLIGSELGESISVAYLSQLESGKREHMTAKSRGLLARFYKVHPGYLVSDPEGYVTGLSAPHAIEARLDDYLLDGAAMLQPRDPEIAAGLRTLAASKSVRELILLSALLAARPEAVLRLRDALKPARAAVRSASDRRLMEKRK